MSNILEIKDMSKFFDDFTAADSVNLSVKEGEFVSILGPSGCGKTTLLRIVAGFLEESRGEVLIKGKNMKSVSPENRPVNIVFQSLALFPMMNVYENVAFGLKRKKLNKQEIEKEVLSMLERVGLQGFEKKKINELSGGQKQRVAIARSLVMKPSILLLDEPLSALDRKLREHMKVELKELQREIGTTFIYITHDQSEALVMSDRVAVMNKGFLEQVDTPQNLYRNPKTAFVAGFVGENNRFEIVRKEDKEIITKSGMRISRPCLEFTPDVMYIRPEAFMLEPSKDMEDIAVMEAEIKTILFDGANTKMSVLVDSREEVLIALQQNAKFQTLKEGDVIKIGVAYDNIKCYKE
ncbi:MAG: ABC transporter ATP-binding protein [Sulfurovum sp.]|nr:ABC transporter ATP-binding protein [Sulfurovum sp.]